MGNTVILTLDSYMRATTVLFVSALLGVTSASASAGSALVCDYRVRYDIEVVGDRIHMSKAKTAPEVQIIGDRLWVDAQEQPLSAIQRDRLIQYRQQLVPFTRGYSQVAMQGLQLGIQSASLAIATSTGEDLLASPALLQPFDDLFRRMRQRFDGRHLGPDLLGTDFHRELSTAIVQAVRASVNRLQDAATKPPSLSLRGTTPPAAGRADALLDARMPGSNRQIEQRSDALCGQAARLDALENALGLFDAFDRNAPSL